MLEMKIIGLTGLLFRGDAKLARERGFGWMGGLTGLLFLGGRRELARGAIPLDVFVSLWVE